MQLCVGRACADCSDEESDDKNDNSSDNSSTFDVDEEVYRSAQCYLH